MDGAGSSEEAKATAAASELRSRPSLRVVTRSSSGGGANGGANAGSDDDDEFHELSHSSSVPTLSARLSGGRGTPRTPPPGPGLAAALSVGTEAGSDGLKKREKQEAGEKNKESSGYVSSPKEDPSPLAAQQQPSAPLPAAPAKKTASPVEGGGLPSPGDALFRVKDLDTGRELKVRTVRFELARESKASKKNRLEKKEARPALSTSTFELTFPKLEKQKPPTPRRGTPSETSRLGAST